MYASSKYSDSIEIFTSCLSKNMNSEIIVNYLVHVVYEFFNEIAVKIYKNRRCGMIVHETAIHQMTVEFQLLQVDDN